MSLFIIQLLFISAVVLMVRSAPVSVTNDHLQKRDANDDIDKKLEIRLFCAAKSLHDTAAHIPKLSIPSPPLGPSRLCWHN